MSAVFWTVIALVIVALLGCFHKMFPGCFPSTKDGINYCCSGWKNMCVRCARARANRNQEEPVMVMRNLLQGEEMGDFNPQGSHDGSHLMRPDIQNTSAPPMMGSPIPLLPVRYPNLENHYEIHSPRHEWVVKKGILGEYLITTVIPDGQGNQIIAFYDITEGKSVDSYNQNLSFIRPPDNTVLEKFRRRVDESPVPQYIVREGLMILKDFPHVMFSQEVNQWINKNTRRIVSGFESLFNQRKNLISERYKLTKRVFNPLFL